MAAYTNRVAAYMHSSDGTLLPEPSITVPSPSHHKYYNTGPSSSRQAEYNFCLRILLPFQNIFHFFSVPHLLALPLPVVSQHVQLLSTPSRIIRPFLAASRAVGASLWELFVCSQSMHATQSLEVTSACHWHCLQSSSLQVNSMVKSHHVLLNARVSLCNTSGVMMTLLGDVIMSWMPSVTLLFGGRLSTAGQLAGSQDAPLKIRGSLPPAGTWEH